MANVAGYFGFQQWGTNSGPVNFAEQGNFPYRISSSGGAIYFGDAVRFAASNTGYIVQWANGDGAAQKPLVGIFLGCKYFSTGQQKTVWRNYWPGSDATGDVEAFVCDDPASLWKVQANAGPINQTNLGETVDIASTPSGNTTTGISGMSLSTPSNSAATTLPFKIVSMITTPPGANGTDITTASNYVIVCFNNQIYKNLNPNN